MVIYFLVQEIVKTSFFPGGLSVFFFPYDIFCQVAIGYVLYSFSRKTSLFLFAQLIMMATIYVGHAIKITILGSPLTLDDIYSFSALFHILDGGQKALLLFPFVAFIGLFAVNFQLHRKASSIAAALLMLVVFALVFSPKMVIDVISSKFDYRPWSQLLNYRTTGGTLYLVYNSAHFSLSRLNAPSEAEVKNALNTLKSDRRATKSGEAIKPRNVILILMEGFWDPTLLRSVAFSEDPWDTRFRKLWNDSGNSQAMSPVFGGLTPNPEFELLTGHPANLYDSRVLFTSTLKNTIPGLPGIFSDLGYETIAMHANRPSFWNRVNAYNRLGFQCYYADKDFELHDMNNNFLADESFFRQSAALLDQHHHNKPTFTYLLTISGHWPFVLDLEKRPPLIQTNSPCEAVFNYANLNRYASTAVMNFIDRMVEKDPNVLLVVLGDHLPPLTSNSIDPYVESGLFAYDKERFTGQMYQTYSSTPLIIIDGKNGLVNAGTVAMYEIPHIILTLLKFPNTEIVDVFRPPSGLHIRPFEGASLVMRDKTDSQVCRGDGGDEMCYEVQAWLKNVRVLDRDILIGKQYSLDLINNY